MQVLLRNPLADPYVLGISGGAAVGALAALSAGVAALVMPAAFAGAFASTLVVFGLARAGGAHAPWTAMRLLLTGVVVAAGWGAIIALLLTLAPDAQLRGMLFWLIGDLSAPPSPLPALVVATVLIVTLAFARDLTARAATTWRRRWASPFRARAVRCTRRPLATRRCRHDGPAPSVSSA